jgi:hypothetical protein
MKLRDKDIWAIELEPRNRMIRGDVLRLLSETAQRTHDVSIGIAGVLIEHGKRRQVSQIYLVDDPSRQCGPTPYEAVSTLADEIADSYDMRRTDRAINSADSKFLGALRSLKVLKNMRLGFSIMGVEPGYQSEQDASLSMTCVDVEEKLPEGSTIEIDRGHLFSARYGRELWHESAALLAGPVKELTEVVPKIADEFTQQRVVIKTPGRSIVYARLDNQPGVAYEHSVYP